MKQYFAGLALAAFIGSSAHADQKWAGPYIGANVGYGSANSSVTSFIPNDIHSQGITCDGIFGGTCALPASQRFHGAFGGVQFGYNWQTPSNWILGLETDINRSNIKGNGINPTFNLGSGASNFRTSGDIRWFGTARVRIGYAAGDLMLYGTGGLAYGRENRDGNLDTVSASGRLGDYSYRCQTSAGCFTGNSSRLATGWTLGGGFEYAIWDGISLKGEYLYVDLNGNRDRAVLITAQDTIASFFKPTSFSAVSRTEPMHTFRVGLNFKLGSN